MLTREQVKDLRDKLQEGLDVLAEVENLGFKLTIGSGRFGATAVFKLECSPIAGDGTVVTTDGARFKSVARLYGLEPTDLGRTFRFRGHTFKVTGLNPGRPRFPVTAERSDGKGFKFTAEDVKRHLAAAKK